MKKLMIIILSGSLLLAGCGSAYVDNKEEVNNENVSLEEVHVVEEVKADEISEIPESSDTLETTEVSETLEVLETSETSEQEIALEATLEQTSVTEIQVEETPATKTPATEVPLTEETKPIAVSGPLYEVVINGYGVSINTDIALLVDKLGTPDHFQSASSCLGAGLDKIYTYSGITLYTQPEGAKDIIYLIEIDAGGKLGCGIGVGSPLSSVIDIFGANYTQSANYVSYIINGIEVDFEITNNAVSYIEIFKN